MKTGKSIPRMPVLTHCPRCGGKMRVLPGWSGEATCENRQLDGSCLIHSNAGDRVFVSPGSVGWPENATILVPTVFSDGLSELPANSPCRREHATHCEGCDCHELRHRKQVSELEQALKAAQVQIDLLTVETSPRKRRPHSGYGEHADGLPNLDDPRWTAWRITLHGRWVENVRFLHSKSAEQVRKALVAEGYPEKIRVRRDKRGKRPV